VSDEVFPPPMVGVEMEEAGARNLVLPRMQYMLEMLEEARAPQILQRFLFVWLSSAREP
jgi:hypothetical protein